MLNTGDIGILSGHASIIMLTKLDFTGYRESIVLKKTKHRYRNHPPLYIWAAVFSIPITNHLLFSLHGTH